MTTPGLERWDFEKSGEPDEGQLRQRLEAMGYRVSRYVYPPGTAFPPHTHGVDKIDVVLSGQFEMTIQGESVILGRGDWLVVPRGVVHSAAVIGDQAVVSLDAIR